MIYFLFLALATSLLKNHASKAQHPPRIKIKLEVFLEFDCFFFFLYLCWQHIYIYFLKKSNQTRLTAGIKIVTSMSGGHGSLLEKSGPLPSGDGETPCPWYRGILYLRSHAVGSDQKKLGCKYRSQKPGFSPGLLGRRGRAAALQDASWSALTRAISGTSFRMETPEYARYY